MARGASDLSSGVPGWPWQGEPLGKAGGQEGRNPGNYAPPAFLPSLEVFLNRFPVDAGSLGHVTTADLRQSAQSAACCFGASSLLGE